MIDHISKDLLKFLETLKDEGKLLKPEEPAAAFSVLVETGISESLNGQTVYWEDVVYSGNLQIRIDELWQTLHLRRRDTAISKEDTVQLVERYLLSYSREPSI